MLFLSHPDFAFLDWCVQFLVRVVHTFALHCLFGPLRRATGLPLESRPVHTGGDTNGRYLLGSPRLALTKCLPAPPCALYSKDLGAMCKCATASASGQLGLFWGQAQTKIPAGSRGRSRSPSHPATDAISAVRSNGKGVPCSESSRHRLQLGWHT